MSQSTIAHEHSLILCRLRRPRNRSVLERLYGVFGACQRQAESMEKMRWTARAFDHERGGGEKWICTLHLRKFATLVLGHPAIAAICRGRDKTFRQACAIDKTSLPWLGTNGETRGLQDFSIMRPRLLEVEPFAIRHSPSHSNTAPSQANMANLLGMRCILIFGPY